MAIVHARVYAYSMKKVKGSEVLRQYLRLVSYLLVLGLSALVVFQQWNVTTTL